MKTTLAFASLLFAAVCTAFAQFPPFPAADLVLGQEDFISATAPPVPDAASQNGPGGVAVDPLSGKVFVADTENHRILRYATVSSLGNGDPAEIVLGQATFIGSLPNQGVTAGANTLNSPQGIFVDHTGRLWVADQGNHRVLAFPNAASLATNAPATRVLGQGDFTSMASGTSSTTMASPQGVWLDTTNSLWVADSGNNRVLRFDNAPSAGNGPAANGVLGQPDFDTSTPALGQNDLDNPTSVTVDSSGTLWVADTDNNRALEFEDAADKSDGGNADVVIGQSNFNSNGSGTNAVAMSEPVSVFVDGNGDLWVTDRANNRLLQYDAAASLTIGSSADFVLGQQSFFAGTGGLSANQVSAPTQVWIDATGSLWIADQDNNRVLRFTPDNAPPLVTIKGKSRVVTTRARIRIRGTAFDTNGVAEVAVKADRRSYRPLRGTTRWSFRRKLQLGKNRFFIKATDTLGNESRPLRVIVIRQES